MAALVSKDLLRRPVWWAVLASYAVSVIWWAVAVPATRGRVHGDQPLVWLRYVAYATLWLELGVSTTGYRHPLEIQEFGWAGRWRLVWQSTLTVLAGSAVWLLAASCLPRRFHVEPRLLLAAIFAACGTTIAATLPGLPRARFRVAAFVAAIVQELALLRSAGMVLETSGFLLLFVLSAAWLADALRRS